jgi:hypothetical protein
MGGRGSALARKTRRLLKKLRAGGGGSAEGESQGGRDSTTGLTPELAKAEKPSNQVNDREKQFYDDYSGLTQDLANGLPNRFTNDFKNASKKVDRLLENRETLNKLIDNTTKNQAEKDFIRRDFETKLTSVLNQRIKAKFDDKSRVNLSDSGKVNVTVGRGSFDIKDSLKSNGFKFQPGINSNWNKEYSDFNSFAKEAKDLKLI